MNFYIDLVLVYYAAYEKNYDAYHHGKLLDWDWQKKADIFISVQILSLYYQSSYQKKILGGCLIQEQQNVNSFFVVEKNSPNFEAQIMWLHKHNKFSFY